MYDFLFNNNIIFFFIVGFRKLFLPTENKLDQHVFLLISNAIRVQVSEYGFIETTI